MQSKTIHGIMVVTMVVVLIFGVSQYIKVQSLENQILTLERTLTGEALGQHGEFQKQVALGQLDLVQNTLKVVSRQVDFKVTGDLHTLKHPDMPQNLLGKLENHNDFMDTQILAMGVGSKEDDGSRRVIVEAVHFLTEDRILEIIENEVPVEVHRIHVVAVWYEGDKLIYEVVE